MQCDKCYDGFKYKMLLTQTREKFNPVLRGQEKCFTSPGWMHETSAQGWCTGKIQRDQVEREVGGGIGMWNTCKSMLIHVNV